MEIKIIIPTAKVTDFRDAMLAHWPKGDDSKTDAQWIEEQIKKMIRSKYKRGLQLLAEDDASDIVQ